MKKILIAVLLLLIVAGGILGYELKKRNDYLNETFPFYVGADKETLTVFTKEKEEVTLIRGSEVLVRTHKSVKIDEEEYTEFLYGEDVLYTKEDIFFEKRNDCVLEKKTYALREETLRDEPGSARIVMSVPEGTELEIAGFDELLSDGSVTGYYVNTEKGRAYVKNDGIRSSRTFVSSAYDGSIYESVSQNGGAASSVSYYPKAESAIEGNEMPEVVKSLYINADTVWKVDEYLNVASQCGINAFTVDIKDTHILSYTSPVVKEYAPSSLEGRNTMEAYKEAVRKLNDAGYYTIGRITVFKDPAFASDHPDTVILENGSFYRYNGSYWPSIFSRDVWEYNVSLALEAVKEFGFNEIQFDYVRSPEIVPYGADMHNEYDETRVQAITNFVRYATDVLHEAGAYVSIDVFGEISGGYVTAYGQYWPAISNAADVISAMPYPDHFSEGYYGIPQPWKQPYELMYNWGSGAKSCQNITYEPAKVRTWIQVYDSVVDGTVYDASMVRAQIRGLSDAGVNDGYITWNGGASVGKFDMVKAAFE